MKADTDDVIKFIRMTRSMQHTWAEKKCIHVNRVCGKAR
jgi:hypothetical protein